MKPTSAPLLGAVLCLLLSCALAVGEDRPISGKKAAGYEPVDKVVLEFMDTTGAQAATVAVSKDGKLLYSRGYGWSDQAKKTPTPPDALMRVASVTKPITAAAIKNAVRAKQLTLDAKAFDLIAVKPPAGKVPNAKIATITVGHLLEHKGGWDRATAFDPMFRTKTVEKELALTGPATPVNMIEYMLTQPLQFTPGEKAAYSNFGYCVLGRVLEKVSKKPYAESGQLSVFKPLGIKDIKLGYGAVKLRDPREVWYPVAEDAFAFDVMDAHGGLIASAPALCQFLQGYWINGEPRGPGQRGDWTFFGSLPGTSSMVRQ